jgi:hypothetical protein
LSRWFKAFAGGHPNISFFFEQAQLHCHHYVGVLYVSGPEGYYFIFDEAETIPQVSDHADSLYRHCCCNKPVILNMDDVARLGVVGQPFYDPKYGCHTFALG